VNCSKGIEQGSLHLPCEIFHQILGSQMNLAYAVLAGPSHAEEVSRHVPTAVVAAADNNADADFIQTLLTSPTFRVYTQSDVKGVELGGALKNVIAIAAGGCDGKGYGDNTKAALITRGVAEMARLAQAMGARAETIAGLSGLGDLIVTAMSQHSRNRGFGELIASGCGPDAALEKIGAVVEGYKSAKSAYELSVKHGVEMPLVTAVYRVLYGGLDINECISLLLDRGAKVEKLKE
jgi:glycerol-3-phosphate dehydrogenase (NAD(P)+)